MRTLFKVLSLASALALSQSAHAHSVQTLERPAIGAAELPAVDSITADTDVRPFLAPGVPVQVTLAALRRVWIVDPRIRDFRSLQENHWDFSNPTAVPGFGPLESGSSLLAARATQAD